MNDTNEMNDVNQTTIKRAFERPEWYLRKTAYNIKVRAETVQYFTRGVKPKNILDIGCGDGSLSLPLLDRSNRLTLLDRSKSMLDRAFSRLPEGSADRVTLCNEDFLTASLPPHSFDLILCVGVLAYIEELGPFLSKLVSLLAPRGTIIVECSDGKHFVRPAYRAYGSLRRKLGAEDFETVCRSSADVVAAFKERGYQVGNSFRYSQPPPIVRKLLPQPVSYGTIRFVHGTPAQSRAAWLGSECLYRFEGAQN
jgi:ubiquinone/menaquinone biosynthesis C-methylase UbiE